MSEDVLVDVDGVPLVAVCEWSDAFPDSRDGPGNAEGYSVVSVLFDDIDLVEYRGPWVWIVNGVERTPEEVVDLVREEVNRDL